MPSKVNQVPIHISYRERKSVFIYIKSGLCFLADRSRPLIDITLVKIVHEILVEFIPFTEIRLIYWFGFNCICFIGIRGRYIQLLRELISVPFTASSVTYPQAVFSIDPKAIPFILVERTEAR